MISPPDHLMINKADGSKYWKNAAGRFHREDGPAIIEVDNKGIRRERWYIDGHFHRADGPAVDDDNNKQWWIHGKIHRIDGPAWINYKGLQRWYIDSIEITDEVNEWLAKNNITWPFNEDTRTQFKLRFL